MPNAGNGLNVPGALSDEGMRWSKVNALVDPQALPELTFRGATKFRKEPPGDLRRTAVVAGNTIRPLPR